MLANQLYVRPLGRSNFAQSPQKGTRTELIQFIAKRFRHCDKLPAPHIICHRHRAGFWGAQVTSLQFPAACRKQSLFAVLNMQAKGRGRLAACAPQTRKFCAMPANYARRVRSEPKT